MCNARKVKKEKVGIQQGIYLNMAWKIQSFYHEFYLLRVNLRRILAHGFDALSAWKNLLSYKASKIAQF